MKSVLDEEIEIKFTVQNSNVFILYKFKNDSIEAFSIDNYSEGYKFLRNGERTAFILRLDDDSFKNEVKGILKCKTLGELSSIDEGTEEYYYTNSKYINVIKENLEFIKNNIIE